MRQRSSFASALPRLSHYQTCLAPAVLLLTTLILLPTPLLAQPFVLIPFGDSITYGQGDGNLTTCERPPRGYPPRLRASLAARGLSTEMRTRAVCGEETAEGVTRLRSVLANNPDARMVLIMEGTNDLSDPDIGIRSIRDNIRFMIEIALEAGVRPVVASAIPRAPEAGSNSDTAFFNRLIEELTTELDIDFVDQYQLSQRNDLYENYYWNSLHPNARGYDLVANNWILPTLAAARRPVNVDPCEPGDQTLCLNNERFQVEVEWRDFEGNTGVGQAVSVTPDTGYFWFFGEDNIELVVKAIDGQENNTFYWIFYGALSTVEYTMTVVDTMTGRRKVYFNPSRHLASVGDTDAFPGDNIDGARSSESSITAAPADALGPGESTFATLEARNLAAAPSLRDTLETSPTITKRVVRPADPERQLKVDCEETAEVMCLLNNRFAVKARWVDFEQRSGTGKGVELTSDSGYFWFFADTNVEVMVKVIDGRENNDNYWVFYGALSNVEYEIEVTDTETGETVIYFNPSRNFGSEADTFAFEGS